MKLASSTPFRPIRGFSLLAVLALIIAAAVLAPLVTYLLWTNSTSEQPATETPFIPPQSTTADDAPTTAAPTPNFPPPPPPPPSSIADPKSLPPEG